MKLQNFIEANRGQDLHNGHYQYDQVIINTRQLFATEPHIIEVCLSIPQYDQVIINTRQLFATEPHIIEVCLSIPGWSFRPRLDARYLDNTDGENVAFFRWLQKVFLPEFQTALHKGG